jgi:hypothetical protein
MDLVPLHHFLSITVERRPDGLFLHQRTYTLDILKRAVIADYKPCTTPVDLQAKLAGDSGPPVEDASQFRSIAGALQYLTFTWPDIAYAVQQICLHMHDPREPHLTAIKRILRYLRGTPDFGLPVMGISLCTWSLWWWFFSASWTAFRAVRTASWTAFRAVRTAASWLFC